MQSKKNEIWVGVFMLAALLALLFLGLRVADLKTIGTEPTWKMYATFDNIGGLKVSSPVKIGGVLIGRVSDIALDEKTLSPRVTMDISDKYADKIPDTSSLAIRTQGLLGEQFLALNLGFDDPELGSSMLKDGGTLRDTKSALVLEDLIGQFLYKSGDNKSDDKSQGAQSAPAAPATTE
ncbi:MULTISPECIES: outer membrane lipid asymmetry maintenance protein MlaD [Pantoea]|jgi:phospholipid/cholesterol/gamma-HCH transport system substrate-binding protein|uniref:outer membrane lipid asymmetry maintenance protein MlaD n=1 Tax=Pantoea TaxID=53335 RepID=UPI0010CA0BCC|nr:MULTISPECIES: outer membrane lipid asymmetry maintenance protein MlaD [Pantoea]MBD9644120.1 outer membrane lipid asymmetry maintenance protein MlaD [Pantoea sp. PNT02]MBD9660472.1 outer membrane lipid asymmetry maintenance protein MlaD [Pantoea sp. PNT03]MDR6351946.1 phospholipid/cholesterol/gamma-HCH transport system substrate-binding protein [Pantoea sp. SORGH_AS_0659]QCP58296.1 outer membrane lipid asymmetry maintenance protein MlaD [Pantoea sp. SO10]WFL67961.1 outer membrane lipid asymm